MEREVMLSGIGGQGVQLAAKTLAYAAVRDGLEVMVFGVYGGSMRGGNTDSTVVIGSAPIRTPPVVDHAWSALLMHHERWPAISAMLRPGGLAVVDSSVFRGSAEAPGVTTVAVPATQMATELGSARAGAMVALGAFVAASGIVSLEALLVAAEELLPPYRRQHAAANRAALQAGFDCVERLQVPAWERVAA